MSLDGWLGQALVYLSAAVILVPLAARLGLGSVLGYLLAGVVIGPWALGLVTESRDVMHFAEFGVVIMLFLVGLELDPGRLWRLRGSVFGLGTMQMAATTAAILPLSMLLGLPWQQGLALGLAVGMSSTAIALQTLSEKGLLNSPAGQSSFSVLLFQDLAVIPILAIFPLLATLPVAHHGDAGHGTSLVHGLPMGLRAIVVVAAVGAVVAAGRLAIRPLLRRVAQTGLREMFTASALLIVVAVAALMSAVGLSAALGAFVAGVVLANSEYRHELMADMEPFKGLLLGLFFIAVGASIDFSLLASSPAQVAGLVGMVLAVKLTVLLAVAWWANLSKAQTLTFAVVLSQVGEFAFVLFGFAEDNGVLPTSVTAPMTAATAFSMAATPLLLTVATRLLLPRLSSATGPERAPDSIDERNAVIIAGYGRFGQIPGRLLRAYGHGVTVLDIDSDQVDMVRRFGHKVFFGDASRLDLLHAAGAHDAKVLIVAVDDPDKVLEIVHTARTHFPHLAILARARGRTEAYELIDRNLEGVYRETFDAALRVGEDALRLLGLPAHAAHRAARTFRIQDERVTRELAEHRHDEQALISRARQRLADFEQLMGTERDGHDSPFDDHAWDSDIIRQGVTGLRATP